MGTVKTGLSPGQHAIEEASLLDEAALMSLIAPHPNVCGLVGVVTRGLPILVVVEMCAKGSLLSLLHAQEALLPGSDKRFTVRDRLNMVLEVATGMQHLSETHKIVHRDLAARNVLIDSLGICRVADFGLSRAQAGGGGEYYRSAGGVVPIRWTPPEVFLDMRFSVSTDVWSLGILAVEVMTNGETPYGTLSLTEVMEHVRRGGRITKPDLCPPDAFDVMQKCWAERPKDRLSFSQVISQLTPQVEQNFEEITVRSSQWKSAGEHGGDVLVSRSAAKAKGGKAA